MGSLCQDQCEFLGPWTGVSISPHDLPWKTPPPKPLSCSWSVNPMQVSPPSQPPPRPPLKPPFKLRPKALVKALRPKQWAKNVLIAAAPLFAFEISPLIALQVAIAFVAFAAVSSGFYLINDLMDVAADRLHPIKRNRPIAAGQVPIPLAWAMAVALLAVGVAVGFAQAMPLGITLVTYALLQVAYNYRLKRTIVLDVMCIAAGFVLRAVAGGSATGVTLSPWFLLCISMLALFFAIEKRKAELRWALMLEFGEGQRQGQPIQTRSVLLRYSMDLLSRMEGIVSSSAIVFYSLWSAGPQLQGAPTKWMLITVPFVLYGVFRYQLVSDPKEALRRREMGGSAIATSERPEEMLLSDWAMLLTAAGWVVATAAVLCLHRWGVLL
jgi:decaprenyl-phosphate phosphoribosyltransferase